MTPKRRSVSGKPVNGLFMQQSLRELALELQPGAAGLLRSPAWKGPVSGASGSVPGGDLHDLDKLVGAARLQPVRQPNTEPGIDHFDRVHRLVESQESDRK